MSQPLPLSEAEILDYLQQHPGFFQRHGELLHSLKIPHNQRGSVSLIERQLEGLRSENQRLREEITDLMSVAQYNENIYRHFSSLYIALLDCSSMGQVVDALSSCLKEPLHFSSIVLKPLNQHPDWLGTRKPLCGPPATDLIHNRLGNQPFYLGRLKQSETELVFDHEPVASAALVLLEDGSTLLGFGSTQPSHFHPQLDLTLLSQLRQLVSAVMTRLS